MPFRPENPCSISPGNHAHAPGSSRQKVLNVLTSLGYISPSFDLDPQTEEQDLMPQYHGNAGEYPVNVNINIKLRTDIMRAVPEHHCLLSGPLRLELGSGNSGIG
jgi:hypothetical protein